MRRYLFFILLYVLLSFSSNIFAWGTTGHRTIAEIAERNLTCKAKRNVKKLLDNQHMAYWSNWADFIKSDTTGRWDNTHVWHFVNAPKGGTRQEYVEHIKNAGQGNLYSAVLHLETVLKDKKNPIAERREALIFLIHLVGDMHQPMHAGREEDRGGNFIKLTWFGQKTNLHSLWDSKLVDNEKYSYTEYAAVLNVISKKDKKRIQEGTVEDWLYDSHLVADNLYAMVKPDDELSYNYFYKVSPILNSQLQKAGLRLAKLLNDIF